jgi:hypothetical protein
MSPEKFLRIFEWRPAKAKQRAAYTIPFFSPSPGMVQDFPLANKIAMRLRASCNPELLNTGNQFRFAGTNILIFSFRLRQAHIPAA